MTAIEITAGRENGNGLGRTRPRGYAPWSPQTKTRSLLGQIDAVLAEYEDRVELLRALPRGEPEA